MEKIDIAATARTPLLSFDPANGRFLLEGESYPEDTKKFYDGPLSHVYSYLDGMVDGQAVFSFKLKYFNSSSAKVLMDLFLAIEESASRGNPFKIEWHYAADDDNMQELGEEFAEELDKVEFAMVAF
jgi:SiaC family regulatory phosphoprotein